MTAITETAIGTPALFSLAGVPANVAALSGSGDTFSWDVTSPGNFLMLENPTGGAITNVNLLAASAGPNYLTAFAGKRNLGAGITVASIAAGDIRIINLDKHNAFLQGSVTITGGTGLNATLITLNP
jgi:hypothetical protein